MATSLIVPCTASEPMSPPGKNSGEMTKPSVVITIRPASHLEAGLVVALREPGIVEVRLEQLLDELRHRPAARAVAEIDAPGP